MTSEMRFEQMVRAEPAGVYRMLTNSTAMREWLADRARANPVSGGCLYLEWQSGHYADGWFTALEPDNQVAFTMRGREDPAPSQVDVRIEPCEGGSMVTLVHSKIGEGGEWEAPRKGIRRGWELAFQRLANVLDSGPDLRITTRPMLGILFGTFDPETARKLDLPVSEGLLLTGTVDGMGAQKAGLQKNDLIVAMDGQPVVGFTDVPKVMHGKKAGDALRVAYYRGAEKREVEIILSQQPLPEIPMTVAGLAEALRQIYQREQAELESVLEGVTEEEAAFKPGEKDWSVKEILAHLIHSERGSQNFISEIFVSQESVTDGYGDNVDAYVRATTGVYGTAQALEKAFHASREETLGLVANLPESFEQRKSSMWRLGYLLLSFPYHVHDHAGQMKAAVEKARA
jgi:uncharacterized protein YndB with AHSA1/START domain/uncharacterized damage-inducible protein DinB